MERTVGIAGASGWLGSHLSRALHARGWQVVGYSRSARQDDIVQWRQWDGSGEPDLSGLDAVINLAGEPIDQRWTDSRKKAFFESRVTFSENLSRAIKGTSVKVLLNASAVGYYGDRGNDLLPETEAAGASYLADLCVQWETAVDTMSDVRVCYLRTGVVLGKGGRAWEKLSKIFKLGIGGRLGDGRQWMPWIHLDDEIEAIIHCLENKVAGPVNLVAPGCVTNQEFTKVLGEVFHRPTLFPAPAFMLKLLLGEFAEEGLLGSMRVVPAVLEKSGYQFRYPDLESALKELTS